MKVDLYKKSDKKAIFNIYTQTPLDFDVFKYILINEYPKYKNKRIVNYKSIILNKGDYKFVGNSADILLID